MNIVLFGPYGSGKGTQGKILAQKYNLQVFDTGSELRKHIKGETELGKKIKAIVDRGDLVPNEVIMEVVSSFLRNEDKPEDGSGGYLFDGLPRFAEQAATFDALLAKHGIEPKRIFIHVPRDVAIQRQIGRAERPEDNEEMANKRADVYERETMPMINKYLAEGKVFQVDGTKGVEEVTKEILKFIEN